jgi:rRNA maturation endonuclease Nob1
VREDPTASWHYMDNAGQLQGPFSTECMLSWAHQGWFPHTTLVFAEADEQGAGRRIDAVPELWPPQQEVPSKVLAGNSDIMTTVLKEIQTWGNSCNPREADGEEMLLENLSALSLDGTTRRGNKRVPARAKSNTLTRAQAGKEAWQNFQKTHSSGGGEGEVGEMAHQPHRPPVSFKILGGERCKASRSPDVLPRESSRPNKHLSAASGAKNAVSTDQAPFHGADPDVLVCKKRLLYAIVDTNTWIDEALHLCSKSPGREGKEEVSMVGISKDAFLQGLATTEVKIVVPSQVVRELDGLKSQKELEHGHNRIGMVASVSETAMRARRVIAALRQAAKLGVYTPSRHSEQREGSVGLWSDNTPCAPFIVMEAPDRDERERRHSSQELMKADSRILACALDMRARLQRQAAEVSGKPPSAGVACDVVLVTQDVNLQLLAAVASEGVPMRALSMTELRQELQERETVWRRAYSQQLARCAVAAAVCARSTFSLA